MIDEVYLLNIPEVHMFTQGSLDTSIASSYAEEIKELYAAGSISDLCTLLDKVKSESNYTGRKKAHTFLFCDGSWISVTFPTVRDRAYLRVDARPRLPEIGSLPNATKYSGLELRTSSGWYCIHVNTEVHQCVTWPSARHSIADMYHLAKHFVCALIHLKIKK